MKSIFRWIVVMILATSLLTGLILPVSATNFANRVIPEGISMELSREKEQAISDFIQQAAKQAKKQGYPVHYSLGQNGIGGQNVKWGTSIYVSQLLQTNYPNIELGNSGESISAIGCGVTSFAMILNTSFSSVYPNNTPATVNTVLGNDADNYSPDWCDDYYTALEREYYDIYGAYGGPEYTEYELLEITAYDMYTRGIPFMLKLIRNGNSWDGHYVVADGFDIDGGGNISIYITDTLWRNNGTVNISLLDSYIVSTLYGSWEVASASQFIWA